MKILYLNLILPDHRVEKSAYLAKKEGHEIFFAGEVKENYKPSILEEKNLFRDICYLKFTPKNTLGYKLEPLKLKLKSFCEKNSIDIIHANNVYCAILVKDMNIPFVFDDHEFYSLELKYLSFPIYQYKDFISHIIMKKRYPKWEKLISKKNPVITVSKKIMDSYRKRDPNVEVFLVPNMPLYEEVKEYSIEKEQDGKSELITAYVGQKDFSKKPVSYRNTSGIIELWENNNIGKLLIAGDKNLKNQPNWLNVKSYGYLPQQDIFKILLKSNIGLIGWKPHPYHHFCSLNKIFNYIHFGLYPIYPVTLDIGLEISNTFERELEHSFGFSFGNLKDIAKFIKLNQEEILSLNKKEIIKIARKEFILEKYKENLLQAYTTALEKAN